MSKEWDFRRDAGREREGERERELPEYAWDYCFPGDECGYKWKVLVGKERKAGMVMATTVLQEG
eukprot:9995787-Karenia_brevis.AAC.1